MGENEPIFGVLDPKILDLPVAQQITTMHDAIDNYNYSETPQPHFVKLFSFIIRQYQQITELDLVEKLSEILGNIAGYKLGLNVRNVINLPEIFMMKLLSSNKKEYIASAINYYRKISRVLGPRFVLQNFARPYSSNNSIQTGVAILIHQLLCDFPKFKFTSDDFNGWIYPLTSLPVIGFQLVQSIQKIVPEFDDYDKVSIIRPPSVPFPNSVSIPSRTPKKSPSKAPMTARPSPLPRLLPRNSIKNPSIMYQLTDRQKEAREFIDKDFDKNENVETIFKNCMKNVSSEEWEERSNSYNTLKRIIRYHPEAVDYESIHIFVGSVLEDIESPKSALSLSALSLLSESVEKKSSDMELEFGRVLPYVLKRFAKCAQFFENALNEFCKVSVRCISPKRIVSILMSQVDMKSPKCQSVVSSMIRDSIRKSKENNELVFRKNSKDLNDLIIALYKLLQGSQKTVRDPAKESVKLLSAIYSDSFIQSVQKVSDVKDLSLFMQCLN